MIKKDRGVLDLSGKIKQHILIHDEERRIISGWASVEIKDLQGDIVPVNILERAMYDFMSRGGIIMYGHQNLPIGKVLRWEIRKHPDTGKPGLWIEVEIYRGSHVADSVWQAIKDGSLTGFSISGVGEEEKQKQIMIDGKQDIADIITKLELSEISIVENPANPFARIEYVNYIAKGDDDICEIEMNTLGVKNYDMICKWIGEVYRQYGFDNIGEMVKWFIGVLKQISLNKQEGGISTDTMGVYNPIYGDKATPQMPMDRIVDIDVDEDVYKPKDEINEKDLEKIKQIISELRELLRVFREYARQ